MTATRHRWTKEELAHLNRTVSHSKNKSDAFKKIAAEMDMPWERVRSTYNNHHKSSPPVARKAEKPASRTPRFKQSGKTSAIDFTTFNDIELGQLAQSVRGEVERRAKMLDQIKSIWSR